MTPVKDERLSTIAMLEKQAAQHRQKIDNQKERIAELEERVKDLEVERAELRHKAHTYRNTLREYSNTEMNGIAEKTLKLFNEK